MLLKAFLFTFFVAPLWSAEQEPGRLVDIGGRKVFLLCSGAISGPTVILVGGASSSWTAMQHSLEAFTRVCSYDGAGEGKSERPDHPLSRSEQVDELDAVLQKGEVKRPYVLVGASIGGLLVRRLASKRPLDVAGIVFVDSAHEEQLWRFKEIVPDVNMGFSFTPENLRSMGFLPPRERLAWHADIPLIVLEHGIPIELPPPAQPHQAQIEASMHEMQRDLAGRSKFGILRKAEKSGHDISTDQPEMVIQAVREVLRSLINQ